MDDGIQASIARINNIEVNYAMEGTTDNLTDRIIALESNARRTTGSSDRGNKPITESKIWELLPLPADEKPCAIGGVEWYQKCKTNFLLLRPRCKRMMFKWMEHTEAVQDWNTDAAPHGMAACIGTES